MKIYNEVVIDMNPESPSYGETLHEDSYEYEGDMMLMQDGQKFAFKEESQKKKFTYTTQDHVGNKKTNTRYANRYKVYILDDRGNYEFSEWTPYTHKLVPGEKEGTQTFVANSGWDSGYSVYDNKGSAPKGQFTFSSSGEFDPTSSEFRKSVEETGGFGELAKGYGQDAGAFDEFYDAPLDYAKQQAQTGTQALGLKTGSSLGDIFSQSEQMKGASGLESSGAVDFTQTKAVGGVMGDYLNQKQELSNQLAFQTEDFWKTTEDQFYAELDENIAAG